MKYAQNLRFVRHLRACFGAAALGLALLACGRGDGLPSDPPDVAGRLNEIAEPLAPEGKNGWDAFAAAMERWEAARDPFEAERGMEVFEALESEGGADGADDDARATAEELVIETRGALVEAVEKSRFWSPYLADDDPAHGEAGGESWSLTISAMERAERMREGAWALLAAVDAHAARGAWDEATSALRGAARLVRHADRYPDLLSWLATGSMAQMVVARPRKAAGEHVVPAKVCAEWAEIVEMTETMSIDSVVFLRAVEEMESLGLRMFYTAEGDLGMEITAIWETNTGAGEREAWASPPRHWESVEATFRNWFDETEGYLREERAGARPTPAEVESEGSIPLPRRRADQAWSALFTRLWRVGTASRATRAALLVEAHHALAGAWPESLEAALRGPAAEMSDAWSDEILADPWYAEPIRYERGGEGDGFAWRIGRPVPTGAAWRAAGERFGVEWWEHPGE